MGLTHQSCGAGANKGNFHSSSKVDYVIALAGNPNTGKSTVFNALTGLNQHTGNWPGKTVLRAEGKYINQGLVFRLVDLPGTYSLLAHSVEEQVARDYLYFGRPDATIVVVDATCLERNLNLVLQVLEITPRVIVCVNLVDEAKRKNILIDTTAMENLLGVPVVATTARDGVGLDRLVQKVTSIANGSLSTKPFLVRYNEEIETAISKLEPMIKNLVGENFNSRWLALRLLDRDQTVLNKLEDLISLKNEFKTTAVGQTGLLQQI